MHQLTKYLFLNSASSGSWVYKLAIKTPASFSLTGSWFVASQWMDFAWAGHGSPPFTFSEGSGRIPESIACPTWATNHYSALFWPWSVPLPLSCVPPHFNCPTSICPVSHLKDSLRPSKGLFLGPLSHMLWHAHTLLLVPTPSPHSHTSSHWFLSSPITLVLSAHMAY